MPHEYQSTPHAAPLPAASGKRANNGGKYRDEGGAGGGVGEGMAGLLADPRVMRGNTYGGKGANKAAPGRTKQSQGKQQQQPPQHEKKPGERKWVQSRAATPPAPENRQHCSLQTDEYVEVLYSRQPERSADTQTLTFNDRPSTPLFTRAKLGADMDTQVMPGDIFAFDIEVEPILEVLISKTMHGAMLELLQEEELEAIHRERHEFETTRNTELAEVQRLEAEARRKADEKFRREEQARLNAEQRAELEEKLTARRVTLQCLAALHEQAFEEMTLAGMFYDPVRKEVEDLFMPELVADIKRRADAHAAADMLLRELVSNVRDKAREFEAQVQALRVQRALEAEKRLDEARVQRLSLAWALIAGTGAGASAGGEMGVAKEHLMRLVTQNSLLQLALLVSPPKPTAAVEGGDEAKPEDDVLALAADEASSTSTAFTLEALGSLFGSEHQQLVTRVNFLDTLLKREKTAATAPSSSSSSGVPRDFPAWPVTSEYVAAEAAAYAAVPPVDLEQAVFGGDDDDDENNKREFSKGLVSVLTQEQADVVSRALLVGHLKSSQDVCLTCFDMPSTLFSAAAAEDGGGGGETEGGGEGGGEGGEGEAPPPRAEEEGGEDGGGGAAAAAAAQKIKLPPETFDTAFASFCPIPPLAEGVELEEGKELVRLVSALELFDFVYAKFKKIEPLPAPAPPAAAVEEDTEAVEGQEQGGGGGEEAPLAVDDDNATGQATEES